MRKHKKLVATVAILILLAILIAKDVLTARLTITGYDANYAYNIIEELSSQKYDGRRYGTEENMDAVHYLAEQFKNIGLKPIGNNTIGDNNTYLSNYSALTRTYDGTAVLELLDDNGKVIKQYQYGTDFREYAAALSMPGEITSNYEFFHYYRGMEPRTANIENSIAIVPHMNMTNLSNNIFRTAYSSKYSAVIVTVEDSYNLRKESASVRGKAVSKTGYELPSLVIKQSVYNDLSSFLSKGYKLHMKTTLDAAFKPMADVMGMIPGSSSRYLLITSHIDHIGPGSDGYMYPGALDNASGVGIMTEIARFIKSQNIKPKVNIVFIAFNGEEGGLIGSQRYTGKPPFPLENTSVVNLDMLGSNTDLPITMMYSKSMGSSSLINSDPSYKLRRDIEAIAEKINIPTNSLDEMASDHVYFDIHGVPAVTLIEYELEKTHTMNDDMSNISLSRIDTALKLVLSYISVKAFSNISVYGYSPLYASLIDIIKAAYPLIIALMLLFILYRIYFSSLNTKFKNTTLATSILSALQVVIIMAIISYFPLSYSMDINKINSITLLTKGIISLAEGIMIFPMYIVCAAAGCFVVFLGNRKVAKWNYEGNGKELTIYNKLSLAVTAISSVALAFLFSAQQYKLVTPEFARNIKGILLFFLIASIISYLIYRQIRYTNKEKRAYTNIVIFSLILFTLIAAFYMPIATNKYVISENLVNSSSFMNQASSPDQL